MSQTVLEDQVFAVNGSFMETISLIYVILGVYIDQIGAEKDLDRLIRGLADCCQKDPGKPLTGIRLSAQPREPLS
jgi:hypothetical protein